MRFQGDTQWQRDFRELARAEAAVRTHVGACQQLHNEGALDEARAELALADEERERIELLEHALRDL